MSAIAQTRRSLKILALPLTARTATRDPLTYYHFITAPPTVVTEPTLFKKATNKVADVWAGWGNAKGGWKLKTYQFGEKLVDKMDFEELALKTLDPTLGPALSRLADAKVEIGVDEKVVTSVPLIFPPSLARPPPLSQLRTLVEHRRPKHRKGFFTWMLISPLTAPFMIIPIVPNLPFFFCVWRSWSHWKAFKASEYLEALLQRDFVVPEPDSHLDKIYEARRPIPRNEASSSATLGSSLAYSTATSDTSNTAEPPQVLLSRDAVPDIISLYELPPTAAVDLYRAIDQANHRTSPEAKADGG